ncbi:MAG: hypothetical protein LUE27_11290 [Clostridia bacterium]|nr:hypothetical protein [Clostridia bacterium]
MNCETFNISDLLQRKKRPYVEGILKNFRCPKNLDVEAFIRHKAINFARKGIAATYLVFGKRESSSNESSTEKVTGFPLGCFVLANKPIATPTETPDDEAEKIISRFSYDIDGNGTMAMASLLIAQFAKNDALPDEIKAEFKGSELMKAALEHVRHIHKEEGGCTVYLECEDNPFLIDFYEGQGFFLFGERYTKDSTRMLQYMKVLDSKNTTE